MFVSPQYSLRAHCRSWPHIPDGSGSLDASAGGGSHVNANLMPTITAADKLALAIHDVDIGTGLPTNLRHSTTSV